MPDYCWRCGHSIELAYNGAHMDQPPTWVHMPYLNTRCGWESQYASPGVAWYLEAVLYV